MSILKPSELSKEWHALNDKLKKLRRLEEARYMTRIYSKNVRNGIDYIASIKNDKTRSKKERDRDIILAEDELDRNRHHLKWNLKEIKDLEKELARIGKI